MLKTILDSKKNLKKKERPQKKIIKINTDRKTPACSVLITCGEPNEEGKMQVEMTYEGDMVLAAYLLENAQNILDERALCESQ